MSPNPKCHQNANVTKMQISQKTLMSPNANITKNTYIANITKTKMPPKCNCHQNANVTKTQL